MNNRNPKWKMTSSKNGRRRHPKMEDDITQKWKTTSPKNGRRPKPKKEPDLTRNGRLLHLKWKTTSHKMENDLTQNGIRPEPKFRSTIMEYDQIGRRP